MKGLFLILLLGISRAEVAAECLAGEFFFDGYTTGQNIDIDLSGTKLLQEDVSGTQTTFLAVQFLVPQVYEEQHNGAAYAITFNREKDLKKDTTDGETGHLAGTSIYIDAAADTVDNACMTNRYYVDGNLASNKTQSICSRGLNLQSADGVWSAGSPHTENACLQVKQAKVAWSNVLKANGWFGSTQVKDNGDFTEVFLLATVETWLRFTETTAARAAGARENYLGQMTGNEQHGNVGNKDDRTGEYIGDGGNRDGQNLPGGPPVDTSGGEDGRDWNFPALHMDDERYTLYQIPFILRFPKSVEVQQSFRVGSDVTMLTGLVRQDQISINLNPDVQDDPDKETFAIIDVTVQTEVQYPYAIRGPEDTEQDGSDSNAQLTAIVGGSTTQDSNTADDGTNPARSITPIAWDRKWSCRDLQEGDTCKQNFKFRIVPKASRPCAVSGSYTLEFWADCVGGADIDNNGHPDACSLDNKNTDTDVALRREANGYFTHTFHIDHMSFCPEVIDTVKVRADIKVYHDEDFLTEVTPENVYTNDILFYEVTYRTASDKQPGRTGDDTDFTNNDFTGNALGGPSFIDYVRAVKITADVIIGRDQDGNTKQKADGTDYWDNNAWKENLNFSLGGSRVVNDDFEDDPAIVLVNRPGDGEDGYVQYQIELCSVPAIITYEIQQDAAKPSDCFDTPYEYTGQESTDSDESTNHAADTRGKIAAEYFDFTKLIKAKDGAANEIKENELAFKLRLDERIIPVGPHTDDSHLRIEVLSEVYYKGNRHPTRRRLQQDGDAEFNPRLRSQQSIQSLSVPVHYRAVEMVTCAVDTKAAETLLNLTLKFGNANAIPTSNRIADWIATLKYELEASLGAKNTMDVQHVQHGKTVLFTNARHGTRRLESDEMTVQLLVRANKYSSGGDIANKLQERIKAGKGTIPKVEVFDQTARIVSMDVPNCGAIPDAGFGSHAAKGLESSAAVASTLFAFVVTLVHLL